MVQMPSAWLRRDGEATRQFLVESSEAYLRHHALDGYRSFRGASSSSSSGGEAAMPAAAAVRASGSLEGSHSAAANSSSYCDSAAEEARSKEGEAWPSSRSRSLACAEQGSTQGRGGSEQGKEQEQEQEGKGVEGSEERWGAPFHLQVAYLFRRSLRTRRFEVRLASPRAFRAFVPILCMSLWDYGIWKGALVACTAPSPA
jgi:hypothetical protein